MDEVDAYRAAKLLLDSKGDGAEEHTRERITDLTVQGDVAGRVAWLRIAAAIVVLQQAAPAPEQDVQ